jgi:SAM-dependent methyltransferase
MRGQDLTFEREFDAVFSNAALHWMRPPEAVLSGVRRALKPAGRFIGEMGGHNNTAAIIVALSAVLGRRGLDAHQLSPWYFPSAGAYREKLEAAGFSIEDIPHYPAADHIANLDRAVARHLWRDFLWCSARTRPPSRARRGRQPVAASLGGRNWYLDRRLRPSSLPRHAFPLRGAVTAPR